MSLLAEQAELSRVFIVQEPVGSLQAAMLYERSVSLLKSSLCDRLHHDGAWRGFQGQLYPV